MATVTLVPLGTYPAQTRSFQAAIPAGTTSLTLTIHAPVQGPPAFDYSADFYLSKDGGATWTWAAGAGCACRATDTQVRLDLAGDNRVRADATLNTAMTVQVTAATTP